VAASEDSVDFVRIEEHSKAAEEAEVFEERDLAAPEVEVVVCWQGKPATGVRPVKHSQQNCSTQSIQQHSIVQ